MRYGHYMGYGFYGSYILSILIILIVISLMVFLLYKQQKRGDSFEKTMEILKERYVKEEISADEYREKRDVIESLEGSNPSLIILVDRYVKGEIDSKQFFMIKEDIEKNNRWIKNK